MNVKQIHEVLILMNKLQRIVFKTSDLIYKMTYMTYTANVCQEI